MKVKQLLAKPEAWTKKALARDVSGSVVCTDSEFAVSFCLLGALRRCYMNYPEFIEATRRLEKTMMARNLVPHMASYNDDPTRTHAEVLELVCEADI